MSSVIVFGCIRSLTLTSPHAARLSDPYSDKGKEMLVNIEYAVLGETQGGSRRVARAGGYRVAGLMPSVSLTFSLVGYMVCKTGRRGVRAYLGSLVVVIVGEISTHISEIMQAVTRIMDYDVRGCQPVRQCIVPDLWEVICGRHTNEVRFCRTIEGLRG